MTRLLALVMALSLAGCGGRPDQRVEGTPGIGFVHDAPHHVSCWTFGSGGSGAAAISCLPDSQVYQP